MKIAVLQMWDVFVIFIGMYWHIICLNENDNELYSVQNVNTSLECEGNLHINNIVEYILKTVI